MSPSAPIQALAVVPPGLEGVAGEELAALGAQAVRPSRGAVAFATDMAGFYRLHLQARIPFRLLREMARFPCANRYDLQAGVPAAADWSVWLPPERTLRVEVSGGTAALNHSHFTALQVKNALVDQQRQRGGSRSSVDRHDPDLVIHLHVHRHGEAVLSLDGSGGSLHRRGWRAAVGLAPLKENLAAGLIALTGWDGRRPLVDPFCGSGTLLIEAACAALGRAPGLVPTAPGMPPRARSFALQRWPDFDPHLWDQEVWAAQRLARDTLADGEPLAPIVGRDHNMEVLAQARANAQAAGVAPWIRFEPGEASAFTPPPGAGLVVTNPPHGERLGTAPELEALYADLGRQLKQEAPGWTLWLLSGHPALTASLRLKATRRHPISHGGIDCRWLRYDLRDRPLQPVEGEPARAQAGKDANGGP
ncbi:MAG: THUMP domain-containing protein [Cyanobacteriota bacterium]|nr:THUMP domain-containing protein [Cyanobacteriota bacterium]